MPAQKEIGVTIEKIYYCYDSEFDLKVDGNSNNISAFQADYSTEAIIEYYSGRDFDFEELSEEEKSKYFGADDWSEFSKEEQFVFDGNTVYTCFC